MKVAITCGAPSSEFLAPYEDESWEIWVLGNRLDRHLDKRVTRVFEIHDDLSEHDDPQAYADWLVRQNIPLIVGEKFPYVGDDLSAVFRVDRYPFDKVKKLFGSLYLTSSPAYMMGIAILEGATEIAIYGVDLATDDHEYFWQRPCMEAWIGFAKGRGIKVTIPEVSHIGKCDFVEGRDWGGKKDFANPPFTQVQFDEMADTHSDKMKEILEHIKQLEIKHAAHDGARQAYERLSRTARATEAGVDVKTLKETTTIK